MPCTFTILLTVKPGVRKGLAWATEVMTLLIMISPLASPNNCLNGELFLREGSFNYYFQTVVGNYLSFDLHVKYPDLKNKSINFEES